MVLSANTVDAIKHMIKRRLVAALGERQNFFSEHVKLPGLGEQLFEFSRDWVRAAATTFRGGLVF
jgi:hypothetical protein